MSRTFNREEPEERHLDENQALPRSHREHPENQPGGRGVKPISSNTKKRHRRTRGAGPMRPGNGANFMATEHC